MKKILTFVSIVVLAVSCAKDPIFKTEAVDMCGQWYVTCDAVDASGNVVLEDPDLFGIGQFIILTASTANNTATEMLLADTCDETFCDFRCKIAADPATHPVRFVRVGVSAEPCAAGVSLESFLAQ